MAKAFKWLNSFFENPPTPSFTFSATDRLPKGGFRLSHAAKPIASDSSHAYSRKPCQSLERFPLNSASYFLYRAIASGCLSIGTDLVFSPPRFIAAASLVLFHAK